MTEKNLIRFTSFGISLLLVMLAVTVHSNLQVLSYRRQLENTYHYSLQEATSQVNAIAIDLQKFGYVGTPAQASAISAKVWKNTGAAKTALSHLPLQGTDLEEAYRFLSQAGHYTMYLSRKTARGEEITDEEWQSLEQLTEYARQLSGELSEIQYKVGGGETDIQALLAGEEPLLPEKAVHVSIDLSGMEEQPDGYPTLIYDGPFSDHLLQKSPVMTEGAQQVTAEQAQQIAAKYAGVAPGDLQRESDEDSHMPAYVFSNNEVQVGVTKAGGYVVYLVSGREIGPGRIDLETARDLARAYLEELEIGPVLESYYELSGGILTVNYAYAQEDVICYTDLIKVGIAMDDGQAVFYDARGYLNNHKERDLAQPLFSPAEAAQSVGARLDIRGVQVALIPTGGGNEVLAYEFACTGNGGEDVLVYINTQTGAEEQIFILIENEYGTLAV